MTRPELDSTDKAILAVLTDDGRASLTDIAQRVQLSPAPVKRRIDRMERLGIITGYTALIDMSQLDTGFEAFVELRFAGSTKVADIGAAATAPREVLEVFTVAGDPDALVRIRVDSVRHLEQVVDQLRENEEVIGTKTLMVLGSWRRRTGRGDLP